MVKDDFEISCQLDYTWNQIMNKQFHFHVIFVNALICKNFCGFNFSTKHNVVVYV